MTSNTANLQLPFLAVGQAQKHVTVNESLRRLDALVQLSVVSATTTAQPGSPVDGDVYIVPSGKTGTHWASFANWALAYYRDGAWEQLSPREGWMAYVRDTDLYLHYTGAAWALFAPGKVLTLSATDVLVGRSTSGAGVAEEIACTAAGRALIAGAAASNQRTTLGLGTAAVQNTGTSGANVPLLDGANTWSGASQTFTGTTYLFQATGGAMGLTVRGDTGATASYERSGSSTGGPIFNLQKSRGSVASRSDVVQNDAMGTFTFGAYAGAGFRTGAQIAANVLAATPSATDMESEIVALTSAAASVSPAVRLRIRATVIRPGTDNAASLGDASYRWTEVFAAAGTINTSDGREKTELRALLPAEIRAVKRVLAGIGAFRWLESVARKGEDARLHIGVTAQTVEAAFAAEGLDARRYGLFCADAIEGGAGERLGVRYDQLFALALAAMFGA
jgi:hypothetical protein